MGHNKNSGLDSMTTPSSWMSGLVNKCSCVVGLGWASHLPGVGEAVKVASELASTPGFSLGVSAFSRYLLQGKTRTGSHIAMETREVLLDTGENKHILVGLNPHKAILASPPSLRRPSFQQKCSVVFPPRVLGTRAECQLQLIQSPWG